MKKYILLFVILMSFKIGVSQTLSKETILISTSYGDIKIKLYNETPKHKANFLKLVRQGFYDSLLFHRVIKNFMIQGGDPDSRNPESDTAMLGYGDTGEWIPAEFNKKLFHKKGVLAAAREDDEVNPAKESSGSQFYIVQGRTFDSAALKKIEIRVNRALVNKINYNIAYGGKSPELKKLYMRLDQQGKTDSLKFYRNQLTDPESIKKYNSTPHFTFTEQQKKMYSTIGGTPHLDMSYTVFGEVISGMDVIDKIAAAKTDKNDRPVGAIRMKVSIVNR